MFLQTTQKKYVYTIELSCILNEKPTIEHFEIIISDNGEYRWFAYAVCAVLDILLLQWSLSAFSQIFATLKNHYQMLLVFLSNVCSTKSQANCHCSPIAPQDMYRAKLIQAAIKMWFSAWHMQHCQTTYWEISYTLSQLWLNMRK